MTPDEAVHWLERQGMKVRVFGDSMNVAFGTPVPAGDEIRVYPTSAILHPGDREGSWIMVDHGVVIRSFDDFASAVSAVRDYLIDRVNEH